MSCILDNGFALGCKDQTGGIKEVYIAAFDSSAEYTVSADGTITVASLGSESGSDGASAQAYYKFEQRNEQAEFTQTGNHSVENGTNFWTQAVSLVFSKNDAATRNLLLMLAKTTVSIVVLDQNNNYWLVGESNGADLISSTSGAGKAYGDLSGSSVSLEGKEPTPASLLLPDAAFDLGILAVDPSA